MQIHLGSNACYSNLAIGNTYFGPKFRSTDDKVRKYGSRLGAGLLIAGAVCLASPLSAAVGISLIAAGTLTLLYSFFKLSLTSSDKKSFSIHGSGKVIERSIDLNLESVRQLKINGHQRVVFQQGEKAELRVSGEDNILDLLSETVEEKRLTLKSKSNVHYRYNYPVTYFLTLPNIEEVQLKGTGRFKAKKMHSENLNCRLSGTGRISIRNLVANKLCCNLSGTGKIAISGEVQRQTLYLTGTGLYDAANLQSKSAYVNNRGTGNVAINVTENLFVNSSGTGQCVYTGNPPVKNIIQSGTGSVSESIA